MPTPAFLTHFVSLCETQHLYDYDRLRAVFPEGNCTEVDFANALHDLGVHLPDSNMQWIFRKIGPSIGTTTVLERFCQLLHTVMCNK